MSLESHIRSRGGTCTLECRVVADIAELAGCSHATLYMIAKGHKQPSGKLARRISVATGNEVTVHDLRPDVFGPAPAPGQAAA